MGKGRQHATTRASGWRVGWKWLSMALWSEEREVRGRAGRGVEEVAVGDRGSGRGRRGGEARSSRAAPVQTDARDWRRWCRVSLWDPGTPLLVTAPSGGLVLGPVCCGSLPLWAFLNYEL